MAITNLEDQLKRDEGEVLHVYLDSRGIPTAGIGHNLVAHGIDLAVGTPVTQAEVDEWFQDDLATVNSELQANASWMFSLDPVRLGALQNMDFNMGWGDGRRHGLSTFKQFLALMRAGSWQAAANDTIHTLWAREVGIRAARLAQQIRIGEWQ